jgi:hypothetical protein
VRSAFNFEAVNSKLDERSRGVGMHELVVSFAGERPVIIVETSRVLSKGNRQWPGVGIENGKKVVVSEIISNSTLSVT